MFYIKRETAQTHDNDNFSSISHWKSIAIFKRLFSNRVNRIKLSGAIKKIKQYCSVRQLQSSTIDDSLCKSLTDLNLFIALKEWELPRQPKMNNFGYFYSTLYYNFIEEVWAVFSTNLTKKRKSLANLFCQWSFYPFSIVFLSSL